MQLLDHYILLKEKLGTIEKKNIQISLHELSEILCCTTRNVNFVLKQMEKEKWVQWKPGRGRGNRSQLTLLLDHDEIRLIQSKELVEKGEIKAAFELIHKDDREEAKQRFYEWLSPQFGFHLEMKDNREIDTLRFSFYRTIPALDPIYITRRTEDHMANQLFDTLVKFNSKTGEVDPHLAFFWECDAEGLEWTFFLRKGVHFHHGRELTAEDVAFSIGRVMAQENHSPYRWMFKGIKEICVINKRTVRFMMEKTDYLLLNYLCSVAASIVPVEVVSGKADFSSLPVGTGPFKLVQNDDQMIRLEANRSYFRERAHLDSIEIWVVPGLHDRDRESKQHGVKFYPYRAFEEASLEWNRIEQLEKGCKYIVFNTRKEGICNRLSFRRAVSSVIDKTKMIEELGENRVKPATSFIPDLSDDVSFEYHIEDSLRLLHESGYRGEVVKLYTYDMKSNKDDANWIAALSKKIGINIEVTVLPIEQLHRRKHEADLILSGEVLNEDLELALLSIYLNEGSFVGGSLEASLLSSIKEDIEHAMKRSDKKKRLVQIMNLEQKLIKENSIIFLYHMSQNSFYHSSLRGVTLNSLGLIPYKDIWFHEE